MLSRDELTTIINMLNLKVGQEGNLACFRMLNELPDNTKQQLKSLRIGDVDHRFSDSLAIIFLIWKNDEKTPVYWS